MQPVDSVQYYGKDFMDALRERRIPRGQVQGLADGGPVWKQLQAWAARNLPDLTMTSGYRPGAITSLGNVSNHALGKAIDLAPPNMGAFNKIKSTFGSNILQLIYSPAGNAQVLKGKNYFYPEPTRSDHFDHIHWAMNQLITGSGIPGTSGWTGTPDSARALVNAIPSVRRWDALHSAGPTAPHVATFGRGVFQNQVANHILSLLGGSASPSTGIDHDYTGGNTSVRTMVQQMAAQRGWTGSQWSDLSSLIQGESSWNPRAQNPSSTAYGLFQFLNSTWRSVGATKTSDPAGQAAAGLKYIAQRYGNPSKAWDFWNSHTPHWYGDGAIFNGATTVGVGERGPEAVMPLNAKGVDFMFELMKKNSSESQRALVATGGVPQRASTVSYYSRVDKSTQITGPITVQAQDPDQMLSKLEAKKRMEALKGRR
jgi:SLT domain-containing protein